MTFTFAATVTGKAPVAVNANVNETVNANVTENGALPLAPLAFPVPARPARARIDERRHRNRPRGGVTAAVTQPPPCGPRSADLPNDYRTKTPGTDAAHGSPRYTRHSQLACRTNRATSVERPPVRTSMTAWLPLLAVLAASSAHAAEPAAGGDEPASSSTPVLPTSLDADPVLAGLVSEALARRPEITQARQKLAAERERVPQAGALPDPTLTAGIQNDGFTSIEIGRMETSYYSFMLTQGLPFPGKLGLKRDVQALAAEGGVSDVKRAELATEAEVRSAYVALLVTRGDLALLGNLETLWQEAERAARARYEVGQGSQADLLRAQLERTRLRQQRWALEAAEHTTVQAINRLRGHDDLDEPIATHLELEQVTAPELPRLDVLARDAEARSPELAAARLSTRRASRQSDLARRDLLPDFSISAGVMPRGSFPPMWTVSVGISLPVYAGSKQLRAIDERSARASAERAGEETVRQTLALRTRQRLSLLESALQSVSLYRSGLLVQSEATVDSAVAQYQVGKVPFAAVLEAINGLLADRSSYLAALARVLQLTIDQRALSLEAPAGAAGGLTSAGMGGGSGGGGSSSMSSGGGGAASAPADESATSMGKM